MASSKKRTSAAVSPAIAATTARPSEEPTTSARNTSSSSLNNVKKRRKVEAKSNPATAPLSAVAARKLAREKLEQQEELRLQQETAVVDDDVQLEASASTTSQNSENQEDSDLEQDQCNSDEDDDEDSEEPVASTSYATAKSSKRYFLGGAASMASSTAPSPAMEEDDVEASFAQSEGDFINLNDSTAPNTSVSYSKRPSRRRRRAENAANFYVDPMCTSSWQSGEGNMRRLRAGDGATHTVIGMYPGETIVVRGCCTMTVFRGSITIDSAILSTSSPPLPIFAPSTHSLPTIRAIRAPSSSSTSSTVSAPKAFKLPFTLQILDDLDFPIVISLQSLQTGIEGIESICRLAGMPLPQGGMWQVPSRWNTSSVPQDVQNDTYRILLQPERDLCATVVPHTWHEALSNMPSSDTSAGQVPSCIIQGPKGVGKSTFSKLLVNTLLSRYSTVAYLDCDLGQPEFTPSGFISLHLVRQPIIGTSFTHLSLAQEGKSSSNKMHYLGSATPKNNPAFYLWAISDLIEYYSTLTDEDGQSIPLVINTQGWYKGLGSDLLLEIHRMARPSIAFDFSDSNASNGYAAYGSSSTAVIDPAGETEVVQIQPYVTPENGPPRINASDLRALQFISYFHMKPTLLSSTSASAQHPTWDFSTSLLARRPYSVHWSTFSSIKLAVSDSVRFADLLRALDASIVALREELAEDVQEEGSLLRSYERGFGQNTSQTLGLGLIRSIDVKAQSFHVITPLPTSTLQRVNAITKGDIEVPTVLMVDHTADTNADDTGVAGVEWKKVPYLQSSESVNAGVGHGRRKVRRNVMRRSQFK